MKIVQGDCLDKLKELEENSVDSVVTDPPYGIGFMGKEWDTFKEASHKEYKKESSEKELYRNTRNRVEKVYKSIHSSRAQDAGSYDYSRNKEFQLWYQQIMEECLRVLKPGGHLLSFGGSRTYHRMACAIEDAGFEIRDMIEWVYGSGFPKSLNIGKAVDKLQGNEREFLGIDEAKLARFNSGLQNQNNGYDRPWMHREDAGVKKAGITKGTSEWEGWGTALKPAHEPICMARKPLSEKTVAENCLKWGTGGINIDESRVESNGEKTGRDVYQTQSWKNTSKAGVGSVNDDWKLGRFPANFIHDGSDEVVGMFPNTKGGTAVRHNSGGKTFGGENIKPQMDDMGYGDSGSAARFFYCAKASKSERNKGLEGFEEIKKGSNFGNDGARPHTKPDYHYEGATKNVHPTVKPLSLMRYLCKLVTPKGGTVLDPFTGSGTTGIAAKLEGFEFIGIEKEEEYVKIAKARIDAWKKDPQQKLL